MKSNIFIPKTIKVGCQSRSDTFTKRLAYVIYTDEKGKLRKETSWENWRDKKIEPVDFDNVPTSGFVLNKKAGGYATHWHTRRTTTRVYDPRDFEFEISIDNLIYVLENTNSIKGKGLDGEFVYGWDGKDLVLLPVDSPDYKEIATHSEAIIEHKTIKAADMKPGYEYLTKKGEKWVYLGKFDAFERTYCYSSAKELGKKHFFHDGTNHAYGSPFETRSDLKSIMSIVSDKPVESYADMMDKLEKEEIYSPYDGTKDVFVEVDSVVKLNEFANDHGQRKGQLYLSLGGDDGVMATIRVVKRTEKYEIYVDGFERKGATVARYSEPHFYHSRDSDEYTILRSRAGLILTAAEGKVASGYYSNSCYIWEFRSLQSILNGIKIYTKRRYLRNGKKYKEQR